MLPRLRTQAKMDEHNCYKFSIFFFNDTATTEIYTLSLHDALPISRAPGCHGPAAARAPGGWLLQDPGRSEEHTSELQSRLHLVCRLLLEKKKHNFTGSFLPIHLSNSSLTMV